MKEILVQRLTESKDWEVYTHHPSLVEAKLFFNSATNRKLFNVGMWRIVERTTVVILAVEIK